MNAPALPPIAEAVDCDDCDGAGRILVKPGDEWDEGEYETCDRCHGTGLICDAGRLPTLGEMAAHLRADARHVEAEQRNEYTIGELRTWFVFPRALDWYAARLAEQEREIAELRRRLDERDER